MLFAPHIDTLDLPCHRLHETLDGLRVLHLSDLHVTRWTGRLAQWQREFARLTPDVVVITGDLGHRSWRWKTSLANVQRLIEPLTPPLATYFILGNHDSLKLGPALAMTTDARGGPRIMLQNQTVFISRKKGHGEFTVELPATPQQLPIATDTITTTPAHRLALVGVHQHRRIDTDIPQALREVRPQDFKLFLLHYPDLVHQAIAAGADICLAGHTHGGQICWPDGRPLMGQDVLPATMCTGVHKLNGTWLLVNRGIGSAGVRVRLFCPPQVIMLTLRSEQGRRIH